MTNISISRYRVYDVSKPVPSDCKRMWFNDGIWRRTGWYDIPSSRVEEAKSYWDEVEVKGGVRLHAYFTDMEFTNS